MALPAQLTDVSLFHAMSTIGDIAIHAVIDLARTFDRAELEAALDKTIGSFPVLGHAYSPRFWRDAWVPVTSPLSASVHVEHPADLEAATTAWIRRPIAPTEERPLRVVALHRPKGIRLVLTILHIAVDGAGIAAVGHVYGAHLYGRQPSVPADTRRDLWRALEGLRWFHVPALARGIASALARPLRQLSAQRRARPYPTSPDAPATWRDVVIPKEQLETLRKLCRGATVNDVLLGGLARASALRTSGPVVVTYTMDLRRYGSAPRLMAANSSTFLSMVVGREAHEDLPSAVRAVAKSTAKDRKNLAGPGFMFAPYALGTLMPHSTATSLIPLIRPILIDLPLERGLMVTNVGRVDVGLEPFGNDIESIRIIGPNIHNIPVPIIVAYGFRGALHLHLYAGRGMAPEVLDQLAQELEEALRA
jgi:NRPS condensation-like uncharacterized protein